MGIAACRLHRRIGLDPLVVPRLDAGTEAQGQKLGQRRAARRQQKLGATLHLGPCAAEVLGDVDAVEVGRRRGRIDADPQRVEAGNVEALDLAAVEELRVLDQSVDVAVVLVRAGGGAELDAPDRVLGSEAVGVDVESLVRARLAVRREVEAVGRRLGRAVEVGPRPRAPADGREDLAAVVAEVVFALDDDVGDDVGEEAVGPCEWSSLAAAADRQLDVLEGAAVVSPSGRARLRSPRRSPWMLRVDRSLEARAHRSARLEHGFQVRPLLVVRKTPRPP